MKQIKTNLGVTLIVLVIVIIVLLILAGISLNITLGDNGIINRGEEATQKAQVQKVEADAKMAYKDVYEEKEEIEGIGMGITTLDVTAKMIEDYRI